MQHVADGTWASGMPWMRLGSGLPLVFLPGLTSTHRLPHGQDRRFQLQEVKPFAAKREVWWANRRPGLDPDATMADIAADYAEALRTSFGQPVDVLGFSTGGSVALQLAVDHPDVVRRLVILSAAGRLSSTGRRVQRLAADEIRAGRPRRAAAAMMAMLGNGPASSKVLAGTGWLLGPVFFGDADKDMLTTIDAEDAFNLMARLSEIVSPVLVVGGGRDKFYSETLFQSTAEQIPNGRLVLYKRRGHVGTGAPGLAAGVLEFLDGQA
ncbi:hypothetical protein AC20117_05125 [Arthrobacter crystallopoietes]|nr:hypothetical protein AC20117_05125 [Arthrobacter crystallopoietes]